MSHAYDAIGNLKSKSDVGASTYGDPAHPHAVTDAATSHYGYDAVGNQISDCSVAGQSGCYVSQDASGWFLEHGKKLRYGALGVAAVAGIVVAWQLLPTLVVEVGAAEGATGAGAAVRGPCGRGRGRR